MRTAHVQPVQDMNVIIPDSLKGKELESLNLKHPRTGEPQLYFKSNDCLYELVRFKRQMGCLFIDDTISDDASISMITPVDPLFFLLPVLQAHRKQFRSLDDLFESEAEVLKRIACDGEPICDIVCDSKTVDDDTYFRYSEQKTMKWLRAKTEALVETLKQKAIGTSGTSVGLEDFKFMAKGPSSNDSETVKYACALLNDYLSPEMSSALRKEMHVPVTTSDNQTDADLTPAQGPAVCGAPKEDYFVDANYGAKLPEKKLTRAEKQLLKGDKKGIRTIDSIFKKK